MKSAYTLIELLIVIGVLAILTGLASLSMVSFSKGSEIEATSAIVSGALKEAKANSLADINDQTWGVYLENERVIVFADSGGGYNPGDPNNSARVLANKTSLSWSLTGGGERIEFAKRTGITSNDGTITITGQAASTKTISINSEGMIE